MTFTLEHKPATPTGPNNSRSAAPARDPELWLCLVLAISGALCFLAPSMLFPGKAEPAPQAAPMPPLRAGDPADIVTAALPAAPSLPLPRGDHR